MENMHLQFVRLQNGIDLPLPAYTTNGAAGMDIVSAERTMVHVGKTKVISTGWAVEIPEGFEIQIRSRSGLAAKQSVFVLNSPGTIDSDYRGEIKIILRNEGNTPFYVYRGDRIAQLVLAPVLRAKPSEAFSLSHTVRGDGGLGSTGR